MLQHRLQGRDKEIAAALLHGQSSAHDFCAAIHFADPVAVMHAHAGVECDIGALGAQRFHFLNLVAWQIERHDEQSDTSMFRQCRIGAGDQQAIIGKVALAGEHFLAVDDPVFAIAHRLGFRGEISEPHEGSE